MLEPISHQHPAYLALKDLAGSSNFQLADPERWTTDFSRQGSLKEAAVLILFGVLDDQPATCTVAENSSVGEDLDLLIVVRAESLRHHAGQPAFPGGKVDPQDYLTAQHTGKSVSTVAALREAVEETGLDPEGVEVLGELAPLPLAVSNFMVTPVLAWWKSSSPVQVQDANESALVLRVPVADLLNPQQRHTAYVKRGTTTHKSPAFTVPASGETFVIWGFTGIVLDRLFDTLGWSQPWDSKKRKPAPLN